MVGGSLGLGSGSSGCIGVGIAGTAAVAAVDTVVDVDAVDTVAIAEAAAGTVVGCCIDLGGLSADAEPAAPDVRGCSACSPEPLASPVEAQAK